MHIINLFRYSYILYFEFFLNDYKLLKKVKAPHRKFCDQLFNFFLFKQDTNDHKSYEYEVSLIYIYILYIYIY